MLKATGLTRVSSGVYKLSYVDRTVEVKRTPKGWTVQASWNPNLQMGPYKQKVRARNIAAGLIEARVASELAGKAEPAVKRGRGRPKAADRPAVH